MPLPPAVLALASSVGLALQACAPAPASLPRPADEAPAHAPSVSASASAAEPPGAPAEPPPPEQAVQADAGASSDVQISRCPEDMLEIQGEFCAKVEETCQKKRKPWQCAEFERPTRCVGKTTKEHYCIDRYEWPNRKGAMATVMVSWEEARTQCKAIGKRLCTDAEWTLACEGSERWPFPYGYERDASACNIDKPSPKVNEARLFSPRTQEGELSRLDQREPSGARERCTSPFGVRDLTGNVDEWVMNEGGVPYRSALKGGNWGEYRNACRPATLGHAEGFRYYQIGYRCCRDPDMKP